MKLFILLIMILSCYIATELKLKNIDQTFTFPN